MDRSLMLKVMVPVGAFAGLLIVVGAVIALANGGGSTPTSVGSANPIQPTPDSQTPDTPAATPTMDFALDGPEWKALDNGLKIWDVKEGTGDVCPTISERPNVVPIMHYTGWLTNGTSFDSSRPRNQPLALPLSQLIPGWQSGVPGMKVGGVRRLLIPSDLGYGPRGSPPRIPGGATLVFEMELLDVK